MLKEPQLASIANSCLEYVLIPIKMNCCTIQGERGLT